MKQEIVSSSAMPHFADICECMLFMRSLQNSCASGVRTCDNAACTVQGCLQGPASSSSDGIACMLAALPGK